MKEVIDVSIDIETYSLRVPEAAVISVAAVSSTGEEFEKYFNRFEQGDLGRHFSNDTIEWHHKTHMEEYKAMMVKTTMSSSLPATEIFKALYDFYSGLQMQNPEATIQTWMKPPSFDGLILSSLANQVGIELPWTRHEQFDLYTLKQLALDFYPSMELPPYPANAHMALVDARYQLSIIRQCKDILL